ncbi:hypothetical protein YC2023_045175 [Brassica napus]
MVRAGKHGLPYKGNVVSREPCNLPVPGKRPHRPASSPSVPATKPFSYSFFQKGLRFITPKAFSELLKLSREYQMLTVTKVTDFRWTRSQRVQSKSITSLRLQKRSPTLIGIALRANRAESLPFLSMRVASLL